MKADDAFYGYEDWLKLCKRLRTAHMREIANVAELRKALEIVRDAHYVETDNNGDSYEGFCVEADDGTGRPIICVVESALGNPYRNCDRFVDELDAQIAFLNEVWLISVSKENMIEKDRFENWTEQMKERYGRWLMEHVKEKE